jgi:hypothetical protein
VALNLQGRIDAIEAQFKALHGPERVPFVVGNQDWDGKKVGPAIGWLETGGVFAKPRERGVADEDSDTEREPLGSVATRRRRLEVKVWGKSFDHADELLDHLFASTVEANVGVTFVSYEHTDDRYRAGGSLFVAQCDLDTQVPGDTKHTVTVKPVRSYEAVATSRGSTTEWEFDPNA